MYTVFFVVFQMPDVAIAGVGLPEQWPSAEFVGDWAGVFAKWV
jgi:hypothetical protein